jgi:hypothetical protein
MHGYEFEVITETGELPINWQKVQNYFLVCNEYDLIFYCDVDMVIVRFDEDIADELEGDIGFTAPEKKGGEREINTGLYCVRPTEYTTTLFNDWMGAKLPDKQIDGDPFLSVVKKNSEIQILHDKWNRLYFADRSFEKRANIYHIAGGRTARKPGQQVKLIKNIKTHFGVNNVI